MKMLVEKLEGGRKSEVLRRKFELDSEGGLVGIRLRQEMNIGKKYI